MRKRKEKIGGVGEERREKNFLFSPDFTSSFLPPATFGYLTMPSSSSSSSFFIPVHEWAVTATTTVVEKGSFVHIGDNGEGKKGGTNCRSFFSFSFSPLLLRPKEFCFQI